METGREIFKPNLSQELLIKVIVKLRENGKLRDIMRSCPRYEKYFIPSDTDDRNRDMNEIGHALNTYHLSQEFTAKDHKLNFLNDDEKARIRITALIHDLGELGEGGVSYGEKNKQDETKELEFFENNIKNFFPCLSSVDIELLLEIYNQIAHNQDMDNKEARYFNMIERMGYLKTAMEEFKKGTVAGTPNSTQVF